METTAPDGTKIGWGESGTGRPLLLVHGSVQDSAAWSFVRALLPDGLRVAAMDRRGRGRSGRGSDDDYRLDVEAGGLIHVAEALGGGVVVAAHSFGATITLQALRLGSDLITGAVLYEPPLPGMSAGLGSSEAMLAALADGRHEDALVAFVRDMVKLAPDEIDAYRVSPAWAIGVDLIWTMRREGPALTGLDADITQYSCIDRPIQLLVGPRTAPHRRQAVSGLAGVLPTRKPPCWRDKATARSRRRPALSPGDHRLPAPGRLIADRGMPASARRRAACRPGPAQRSLSGRRPGQDRRPASRGLYGRLSIPRLSD